MANDYGNINSLKADSFETRYNYVESWRNFFVRCLEENRGIVIVLFCLPASFIFDLVLQLGNWLRRKFRSAPEQHARRVADVQAAVREWNTLYRTKKNDSNVPLMCTSRPNWLSLSTTFFDKTKCHKIHIPLYDILELDEANLIVKVEPNVSVFEMTSFLNPRGYSLAVTLEIGDATIGGLAFGVGMTTHSHKVGLYQETILSYDIVTANGELIHVTSNNEHADLFCCLPWSHGTLGFLVALELKIIPIKQFVRLEYIPVRGQEEYCHRMMELSGALSKDAEVPDFLEATIFDKDTAVIMVGNFDEPDSSKKVKRINRIGRWWKPWFYKHTETFLSKQQNSSETTDAIEYVEYIPIRDYLLRHNRAIFWVVEAMIPFGNHPLFRCFLGWLCPPKPAFLKFTTTSAIREMTFAKQVFQDIVMPLSTLKEQVNTAIRLFDTFPLLVYACRIYDNRNGGAQGQLRSPPTKELIYGTNYAMFNDLGVYGVPGAVKRKEPYNPTKAMREMENFTRQVGGYSFLYADIFMTKDEFEQMFDLRLYQQMREKYSADGGFPNLYEKVRPEIDVIRIGNEYAHDNRK